MDKKKLDSILKEASTISNKPAKGVVTKAVEMDFFKSIADSMKEVFRR